MSTLPFSRTLPEEALPDFLQGLLAEAKGNPHHSKPIILSAAIAAISVAGMHHVDVLSPDDKISVISEYVVVVADTGIGKTPIFKTLFSPIIEHLTQEAERYNNIIATHQIDLEMWETKKQLLTKAAKKFGKADSSDDQADAMDVLRDHLENKPKRPTQSLALIESGSYASFMEDLSGRHSRRVLATVEAKSAIRNGLFDHLEDWCTIWENNEVLTYRRAHVRREYPDLLLTALLMLQPKHFHPFARKDDGIAIGSGFLPRCLIVEVRPIYGDDDIPPGGPTPPKTQQFLDCLSVHLEHTSKRNAEGAFSRTTLRFSPEAADIWEEERQVIRNEMKAGGQLEYMREFAAKHMGHVSRLAGMIHYFPGNEGDIQTHTLQSAIAIARYYLMQARRIFDDTYDGIPKTVKNAWLILRNLYRHNWVEGNLPAAYIDVLRGAHIEGGAPEVKAALDHLERCGYILRDKSGSAERIHLDHKLFSKLSAETFVGDIPDTFIRPYAATSYDYYHPRQVAGPPEDFKYGIGSGVTTTSAQGPLSG